MDWDSFRADMLISRIQYWDDLVERWISVLKGRFIGGLCPAAWNHQHGYCCPSGAHQVDGCFDMHLSLLNPPLKVADDTLFMIFRLILLTSNSLHISNFHFYRSRCLKLKRPRPRRSRRPRRLRSQAPVGMPSLEEILQESHLGAGCNLRRNMWVIWCNSDVILM